MAYEQWPEIRAERERWAILGRLLRERRADLGYGSRARTRFASDRGVSVRRFADIEKAPPKRVNTWDFSTLMEIARDYEVTYASMVAVLRGEADELRPAVRGVLDGPPAGTPPADGPDGSQPPVADKARRDAGAASPFDPARSARDRPWFDEINERRVALAARGITEPSGRQMFGEGTDDARAWDSIAAYGIPVGDVVWALADLRRRAAARAGDSGTGAAGA